jgi:hypothetical protein
MLAEYDADGFLGLQVDLYGEERSGAPAFEMHSAYGFLSMPLDPEKDGNAQATANACTVLYGWEGSRGHAWPLSDPRVIVKLPKLLKGGSMQYAATGTYSYMDGKTGSLTTYVPYAFVGGVATKSMSIELNVDTAGQESISIIHGDGMAMTMAQGSLVLKNATGSVYLELNASGGVLNGAWAVPGGLAAGDIGSAQPLVSAPALIILLQALSKALGAVPTTAAAGAAIDALITTLPTKNSRGS